jgi:Lhr-like helicase
MRQRVAEAHRRTHHGDMTKSRREVVEESRRKGVVAGAAAAATVALGATVGLPVAVVAAVPTALLGWRWWKHRAENGIKF